MKTPVIFGRVSHEGQPQPRAKCTTLEGWKMGQLYCGDNLEIMQDMSSESVDLIATDPPFNTGRDWGAFNDKWEGGLKGYLKFMEPRLQECHRVLKETGSLYLHCDPTASHYLKIMLDVIFGANQYRNSIVWKRCNSKSNNTKSLPRCHDTILFYTKSENFIFNYTNEFTDLWLDIQIASKKQRVGYPTQKPVALYERMINGSSNQGDLILDPFCGSGTTLDAAQTLGRDYIGIDQNPDAIQICRKRLNPRQQKLEV